MPVANEDLVWDLLKNALILVVTGILGKIWGNLKQCCSHGFFIDQCLSRSTPPQHKIFRSNLGERSNFPGKKQPFLVGTPKNILSWTTNKPCEGKPISLLIFLCFSASIKSRCKRLRLRLNLFGDGMNHVSWPKDQAIKVTVRNRLMSQCSMKLVEDPHGLPWLSNVLFPNSSGFGVFSHNQKVLGQDCFLPLHVSLGQMQVGLKTVLWKVAPRFPNVFPQSFYPTVSLNVPPCVCKYIHTHMYVHTYIHTYIPTYVSTYVHTYGNMKS